jgi:DNA-binding CsgD family transcriptional regulator
VDPTPLSLSPRDREVLELTCAGMTARQIAGLLGISAGSVANRRREIYQKLQVRDRRGACALLAARARDADPDQTLG